VERSGVERSGKEWSGKEWKEYVVMISQVLYQAAKGLKSGPQRYNDAQLFGIQKRLF